LRARTTALMRGVHKRVRKLRVFIVLGIGRSSPSANRRTSAS